MGLTYAYMQFLCENGNEEPPYSLVCSRRHFMVSRLLVWFTGILYDTTTLHTYPYDVLSCPFPLEIVVYFLWTVWGDQIYYDSIFCDVVVEKIPLDWIKPLEQTFRIKLTLSLESGSIKNTNYLI